MDDASLKRTNDVPRFVQHKTALRLIVLTLLIISMLGPWMFDLIHVPAEYTCSSPFTRLYGDFCGVPVSGVLFFGLFIGGFFQMLFELLTATFINRSRELLIGLLILPLIPFFTTTLFIWKKETRRLQTVNLVAWTMGPIPLLFISTLSIAQYGGISLRLWGLWLYIVTALGAVALEIVLLKRKTDNT